MTTPEDLFQQARQGGETCGQIATILLTLFMIAICVLSVFLLFQGLADQIIAIFF